MSTSVLAISFDAHDAARLAHFWAQALHRSVNDGATEDFASIAADTDTGLGAVLMFHRVPEDKTIKNRMHLDLKSSDLVADADRLKTVGAKQIRPLIENNNRWISFAGPRRQRVRPRRRLTLAHRTADRPTRANQGGKP
jgi:hypothetical protein